MTLNPQGRSRLNKICLFLLCSSFLAPIATYIAHHYNYLGYQDVCSLSLWGLYEKWWWQLLTYPLVSSNDTIFSIKLLFTIAIKVQIFRFIAESIVESWGYKKWLFLTISATFLSGLVAAFLLRLNQSTHIIYGLTAPLFALTTIYLLMDTTGRVTTILGPVSIKPLMLLAMSIMVLQAFSSGESIEAVQWISAALWAIVYRWLIQKYDPPHSIHIINRDGSRIDL